MEITCKIFNSNSNILANNNKLLVTKIKVDDIINEENEEKVTIERKHVVLVIDISGSMMQSIELLKNSILALIDHLESPYLSIDDKNTFYHNNISIITFNDEIEQLWPQQNNNIDITDCSDYVRTLISNIVAGGTTDLHGAYSKGLEIAQEKIIEGVASWVLLFTDGAPTVGKKDISDFFATKLQNSVLNSEHKNLPIVLNIGMGERINPEILNAIGSLSYISNDNEIPKIFGSLTAEILTSYGYMSEINFDINSDYGMNTDLDVVGSTDVGTIYHGKEFYWIKSLPDNIDIEFDTIKLQYFKYNGNDLEQVEITQNIEIGDEPDEGIISVYFNNLKAKYIDNIIKCEMDRITVNDIMIELDMWPENVNEIKQQVIEFIDEYKNNKRNAMFRAATSVSSILRQSQGYNNSYYASPNPSITPYQQQLSQRFSNSLNIYDSDDD